MHTPSPSLSKGIRIELAYTMMAPAVATAASPSHRLTVMGPGQGGRGPFVSRVQVYSTPALLSRLSFLNQEASLIFNKPRGTALANERLRAKNWSRVGR